LTTSSGVQAFDVADELGLEPDWLNDGAKSFMPGNDPNQISVFEGNNLSVAAIPPRHEAPRRTRRS
jgi:hypothetical protein